MNETIDRVESHEEIDEKIETAKDTRPPSTPGKRRTRTSGLPESAATARSKVSKVDGKSLSKENETYRIFQALLLAISVLVLSYHGLRHGRTAYSVLENGQIVNGFVSARRAVITFSLGYSVFYSCLSTIAACMMLYSIVSKKPRWSIPSVVLYMADLVCHVGDALVAFWLFFGHLRFSTASLYTASTILVITGELWIWLGALRLYEHRLFN